MSSSDSPAITPARSLAIGASASLLLAVPFLVFGVAFLDVKACISLRCDTGGPCTLTRSGWLSEETVGTFTLEELKPARVARNRSPRGDGDSIFRPVLETTRGTFPLLYEWSADEAEARRMASTLERFREEPAHAAFELRRDGRRKASRVGVAFTVVGALLLPFSGLLGLKALRRLKPRS